jgi:hypothetical protein
MRKQTDYLIADNLKPCACKKDTNRVDIIFETRVCSAECQEKLIDAYIKATGGHNHEV